MTTTIEATDLRDAISRGIGRLQRLAMCLTSERGEVPRPEYLTTTAVSLELCEFTETYSPLELKIRCEEQTKSIWGKERAHGLLRRVAPDRRKNWFGALKSMLRNASRNGNVDITLFRNSAFEKAVAVIENKGLLHFTDSGQLYSSSRQELKKDLDRNAEFVARQGPTGGIEYSAFTFFLKDEGSVTCTDADGFLATKKTFFEDYVRDMGLDPHLRFNVLISSFDDYLYATEAAAAEPDESGAPAFDLHPAWHIAYGVISIYREGVTIVDRKSLYTKSTSENDA